MTILAVKVLTVNDDCAQRQSPGEEGGELDSQEEASQEEFKRSE